jgi:xanthine dehydrogenase accessory factor
MRDFFKLMKIVKENPEKKFAMATIYQVRGSAYRREGAKMLIGEDGSTYGTISAGCLEGDLTYRAMDAIESNTTKLATYDLMTEDDFGWGQGAGCNGIIDVMVEPFSWSDSSSERHTEVLESINSLMSKGERIYALKKLDENIHPVTTYFKMDGQPLEKRYMDRDDNQLIIKQVGEYIKEGRKFAGLEYQEENYILERYEPKDELIIFGAGPDVEPLVMMATKLDFLITVIDPRSMRCNKDVFPEADHLIVEHPKTYLEHNEIPSRSYVIVMTHNFDRDREILSCILDKPLRYLGVLGPRKRTERLVLPNHLPNEIYSPIGLEIEADGAEEISVSVLAELIKVRNNRSIVAV